MGIYLNPDNIAFQEALNSEIYIDKTELIKNTNKVIRTTDKYVCVSRPRRFGKSIAANMLVAYYSKGCDSKEMFSDLKISKTDSFKKHLNKYNVIRLDIQKFKIKASDVNGLIYLLQTRVTKELRKSFGENVDDDLSFAIEEIYADTFEQFVFVIDEWDCILRDNSISQPDKKIYLDFLCSLFKGQNGIALVYMTGILPIKKYGEHSALNMFTEISMTDAQEYAELTGFTEDEVAYLCEKYGMSFEDTKRWYDGYNAFRHTIHVR